MNGSVKSKFRHLHGLKHNISLAMDYQTSDYEALLESDTISDLHRRREQADLVYLLKTFHHSIDS